ncbi:MAG: hypothetical protein ACJ78Q_19570 [Chloroflexia bacterium]
MSTRRIQDKYEAKLLGAMRARQGLAPDSAFASKLGVPTRALAAARDEPDAIGIPLLAALVRAYPELEELACAYLRAVIEEHEKLQRRGVR